MKPRLFSQIGKGDTIYEKEQRSLYMRLYERLYYHGFDQLLLIDRRSASFVIIRLKITKNQEIL